MNCDIEVGDWVEVVNWCKEWDGLAVVTSISPDTICIRQAPFVRDAQLGTGDGGFPYKNIKLVLKHTEIE